jgi:hypothetical protein
MLLKQLCGTYGNEERGAYRALVGKPEGESHLENIIVNGKTVLK